MNEKGWKFHIAIVDDDALVRESLCDCMESAGYSAEGFASAEEFLASNSGGNAACLILDIACLISDIQLPGVSGLELQRRLWDAAGSPVVFVTANATDANREIALKLGAKGFLSKPVRRQELLNAVSAQSRHRLPPRRGTCFLEVTANDAGLYSCVLCWYVKE